MRVRAIIISNAGRLLLGINQDDKYMLPGGKIKEGEHPVDALLREVKEETNIIKFDSLEYLWQHLGNYIFIFIPEDTAMLHLSCADDPSQEFKALEWVDAEALPFNLDEYTEEIIYRFLRLDILLSEGKEENMKKNETNIQDITAGYINVLVDGKKAFQLDDDTIWETLPRLASERSKGRKIDFQQISDENKIEPPKEVTQKPQKPKEKKKNKKDISACVPADLNYFNKYVRLDYSSELLNPSVSILKMADCFDNTLLFNGRDDFWITNNNKPIWRCNFSERYATYEDIVESWNICYPDYAIDLLWLKSIIEKFINQDQGYYQTSPEKQKCGKDHCTKVVCIECKGVETCRCKTPKKEKKGVCNECRIKTFEEKKNTGIPLEDKKKVQKKFK